MLDRNKDGRIDFAEFSRGLCILDMQTFKNFEELAMAWAHMADVDIGDDLSVPLTAISPSAAKFWAGGIAGSVSRSAVAPLERLKIIYMCGGPEQRKYGVWSSLLNIYKQDGLKGYFRGNGANMIRIFPYSAIQLSVFPIFKDLLVDDQKNLSGPNLFLSGVLAGVTATTITYPLDFIRSRLSLQGPGNQQYSGIFDGLSKVARQEGVRALYVGLIPSLAGIVPYAGVQLSVYDLIKNHYEAKTTSGKASSQEYFWAGSIAGLIAQTVAFPIEVALSHC
jgi:hypothetical protein